MTAAQRAKFKKALQALAKELAVKTPHKIDPNRADEAEVGGDEDEQPLNEMSQAIASNRNRNAALILARVERALEKLKEMPEDFGLCEECGDDIPLPRLNAMPYAELCVQCQSKRDGPKGGPTRRKITDFV